MYKIKQYFQIINFSQTLIRALCFILFVSLFCPCTAQSRNSLTIEDIAKKMVNDLNLNIILAGKKIQVSENNFWQRRTQLNLPFSSVLSDAISAALSGRGVIVTSQEVGDEPLILLGSYAVEGSDIVITLKIRLMGDTASGDIAFARGKINMWELDKRYFKPEFSRVARSIVRLLEDNFQSHGIYKMDVEIPELKPGLHGQPTILLGKEFGRFLENAISVSPLFRPSGLSGSHAVQSKIIGNYINLDNKMRFHVKVVKNNGKTITSSVFDVDMKYIPQKFLKPMAEKKLRICTVYAPLSANDFPVGSSVATTLLEFINESLADHGLEAETCPQRTNNKNFMMIKSRIKVHHKRDTDGFSTASARIYLKVIKSDGSVIGVLSPKTKTLFQDDLEDAVARMIKKIFIRKGAGRELATMILGR
ncbi:exported hypothetical protein [Candidatus Magnetomoraceae bacterium gMMP-15]